MSITGIASSILSSINASQTGQSSYQNIKNEFQQLGQDLQSGNLTQAQSDFATLSQNLPSLSQSSAASSATAAATAATTAGNSSSIVQAFAQLGQDLQSGNLQAAQQDYATVQQDAQQNTAQQVTGHHHHRHHAENSQNSSSSSSSSSPTNSIVQAFSELEQTLQSGNLAGAQSAFSTLQNDLQQIGGFVSSGLSNTAASTAGAGSNVTV